MNASPYSFDFVLRYNFPEHNSNYVGMQTTPRGKIYVYLGTTTNISIYLELENYAIKLLWWRKSINVRTL
jgi:hypothetical protein